MAGTFLESVTHDGGVIDPSALAKAFGITKRRLAEAVGLPTDAITRKSRIQSKTTQARLRDFAEFISIIVAWNASPVAAFRWFEWHSLISFEGRTAECVFKAEGGEALKVWAVQVEAGVHI